MTTLRRPFALWVIVGLYSSLILANFGLMIYMRLRWAVYVFALLLILRLRESVLRFFADQHPDAPPILLWLPHVMMIVPPLLVLLYALHLARKGTLRNGI